MTLYMKRLFIIGAVAATMGLVSCEDTVTKDPLDEFINNSEYWSNTVNLDNQCNRLYELYLGYGNSGVGGWYYFKCLNDDQANATFEQWPFVNVEAEDPTWTAAWEEIRGIGYITDGLKSSSLDADTKTYYEAVARLNRAWQYYQLVRTYGNVPWVNKALDTSDPILYAGREDRDIIMDSVLNDLNFANKVIAGTDKTVWNNGMVNAMKADICLYEGTFCKYRNQQDNGKAADPERAKKYLNECVTACNAVMAHGYKLNDSYKANYDSDDLSSNDEMIFIKSYVKDLFMHSTIDYTSSSSNQHGITKDAFDSFLFLDGKPLASTTLDKSDAAELDAEGDVSISKVLSVRDKRLAAIVDPCLGFKGYGWTRVEGARMTSSTGYTIGKFDNPEAFELYYRQNIGTNYTDAPIFWLAPVYLAYAEAKAELAELGAGTIIQDDLDLTINKLQARAGLPAMTTTPAADPANDMGVSNLIWEIRRCRRCELMLDNWYRYWDLIRWHQLDKLDTNKNPDILLGANVSNIPNLEVDVNADGYIIATQNAQRIYNAKYYLYPIPSTQLTLNPNLGQNPNW